MVVEGQFIKAEFDKPALRGKTTVTVTMILDKDELQNLRDGLMSRRMDTIQMVISSTAVAAVTDSKDTPSTPTTESW
jgi:hypothetical protein